MKATIARNKIITGKNSKSYNDKHPENPISMRPIRDAVKSAPYIRDAKGQLHKDMEYIKNIYSLGHLPRMVIAEGIAHYSHA